MRAAEFDWSSGESERNMRLWMEQDTISHCSDLKRPTRLCTPHHIHRLSLQFLLITWKCDLIWKSCLCKQEERPNQSASTFNQEKKYSLIIFCQKGSNKQEAHSGHSYLVLTISENNNLKCIYFFVQHFEPLFCFPGHLGLWRPVAVVVFFFFYFHSTKVLQCEGSSQGTISTGESVML